MLFRKKRPCQSITWEVLKSMNKTLKKEMEAVCVCVWGEVFHWPYSLSKLLLVVNYLLTTAPLSGLCQRMVIRGLQSDAFEKKIYLLVYLTELKVSLNVVIILSFSHWFFFFFFPSPRPCICACVGFVCLCGVCMSVRMNSLIWCQVMVYCECVWEQMDRNERSYLRKF